jgi:DNA-binding transcriptional ArsR family regulator
VLDACAATSVGCSTSSGYPDDYEIVKAPDEASVNADTLNQKYLMPAKPPTTAPFVLPDAPAAPELVAKYFRGLGDPTRVRLLELLREHGELAVGDLVARLGQSQPKISNHLACLRWCGFVATRREHPSVYYRIADDRVVELLALGGALLADNAEHIAACRRIDSKLGGTAAAG